MVAFYGYDGGGGGHRGQVDRQLPSSARKWGSRTPLSRYSFRDSLYIVPTTTTFDSRTSSFYLRLHTEARNEFRFQMASDSRFFFYDSIYKNLKSKFPWSIQPSCVARSKNDVTFRFFFYLIWNGRKDESYKKPNDRWGVLRYACCRRPPSLRSLTLLPTLKFN